METVLDIFNRHKTVLEKYSKPEVFPAGRPIFRIGEPGDKAHIIVSGEVVISRLQKSREKELATILPGDIIGEVALFTGGDRTATARTKTDTNVITFTRQDLEKLKSENLPIAYDLLEAVLILTASRLRSTLEKFEGVFFWLS